MMILSPNNLSRPTEYSQNSNNNVIFSLISFDFDNYLDNDVFNKECK
jgi:hypothetical protein